MSASHELPAEVAATFARLDRRGFLRLSALLAGAGLLPTGCRGAPDDLLPPEGVTLARFSPRGYATFQAVAMRMVGPIGSAAIRARRIDPARAADLWAERVPALAGPLVQGLGVLEWGIAPLVAKWRPFTVLDGAAQDRVLEDLMHSRLDLKRDLFRGLRSLALLTYYSDANARAGLGHPGSFDAAGIATAMSDLPDATERP